MFLGTEGNTFSWSGFALFLFYVKISYFYLLTPTETPWTF